MTQGNDPDRGRLAGNLSCPGGSQPQGDTGDVGIHSYSIRSLAQAVALLADVGPECRRVGGCPALSRSAVSADLAQYDPALFSYMHLCDAPAIPPEGVRPEAREGRLYPGEGGFAC